MALVDVVEQVRGGVFHIVALNARSERIGSGTGFVSCGHLVSNNHVYVDCIKADQVWIRQDGHTLANGGGWLYSKNDLRRSLIAGSVEDSYDFAVLDLPQVVSNASYSFPLRAPAGRKIGDPIALLGYPLEHDNLCGSQGIISSIYERSGVKIIQLDANVNVGNSGGPLIDHHTNVACGIVTRKATGLSRIFDELRNTTKANIELLEENVVGEMFIGGVDPLKGMVDGQKHLLRAFDEIERQANVGIGYAVSIEHLMNENVIRRAAGME